MKERTGGVTARVVGRSMEPVLWEGDWIELESSPIGASVASAQQVVGQVCAYARHGVLIAHRLRGLEQGDWSSQWLFQGDRQPECEKVPGDCPVWRVRRVLMRPQSPDTARLALALTRDPELFATLAQPGGFTLHWQWDELNAFASRQGLSRALAPVWRSRALAAELPAEFIPPQARERLIEPANMSEWAEHCVSAVDRWVGGGGLGRLGELWDLRRVGERLRVFERPDELAPLTRSRARAVALVAATFRHAWNDLSWQPLELLPRLVDRLWVRAFRVLREDQYHLPVRVPL